MSTLDDRLTAFAAACKVKFAALLTSLADKQALSSLNNYNFTGGKLTFWEIGGVGGGIIAIGADDFITGWPYFSFANVGNTNFGGFGSQTVNGRIAISGSISWEFTNQPYFGTNPLFHTANLISVQSKTGGYTEAATTGLQVRLCNLAAGFTVVLPTAVGNTARFTFKKMLAAGTITIDGNASETIDGALTATLTTQYDKLSIVSDGANWCIV